MGPQAMQSLEQKRLWQRKGGRAQRDAPDSDASIRAPAALVPRFRVPSVHGIFAGPVCALSRNPAPIFMALKAKFSEPHPGTGAIRVLASLAPGAPDQRLVFLSRIGERRKAFSEQERKDCDSPSAALEASGFRCHVPELLRHREVFQDVLLAPLAILWIGLAAFLFSQVVNEGIGVHYILNALTVTGVGFATFVAVPEVSRFIHGKSKGTNE